MLIVLGMRRLQCQLQLSPKGVPYTQCSSESPAGIINFVKVMRGSTYLNSIPINIITFNLYILVADTLYAHCSHGEVRLVMVHLELKCTSMVFG